MFSKRLFLQSTQKVTLRETTKPVWNGQTTRGWCSGITRFDRSANDRMSAKKLTLVALMLFCFVSRAQSFCNWLYMPLCYYKKVLCSNFRTCGHDKS
ncbi:hypothetical protein L596_019792 [Steinernema carpocapsae]|uniref:Uncharacterized protein n=1 Tax=Steinernema carpocapsae TaxID=34508 RepID=A0A4U5MSF4_STECR|nr:hypothetical protein L596_019792 [Steinernema carpocapsae]